LAEHPKTYRESPAKIDTIPNKQACCKPADEHPHQQFESGEPMTEIEIAKPFIKATQNILSTMAMLESRPGKPYVKKEKVAKGDVSAIIGITGDRNGTFAISFSKTCAVQLVKRMLGDDVDDLLSDVQDAVGEISNMISGHARLGLADMGLKLQGSTPSVIMGDNHVISHMTRAAVVAIPFETEFGNFAVEFCFE
jgi:chemotaxis protein CheX